MFSSGGYDLTKLEEGEGRNAYFGSDRSLYTQRSSLPGLVKSSIASRRPFKYVATQSLSTR